MVEGYAQIVITVVIVGIGLALQYGLRYLRADADKQPTRKEIGIALITGSFSGAALVLPQMSSLAWDPQNPSEFALLVLMMVGTVAGIDSITRKLATPNKTN
ncbi:hypothetical protein [Nitrosopumilus sp.]|uniref:hypothetical protein n=1 Tax=Nitrosopumilus sp. TaxID=2024843 RepID=UPI003D108C9F